jgi:hypothetical protein
MTELATILTLNDVTELNDLLDMQEDYERYYSEKAAMKK